MTTKQSEFFSLVWSLTDELMMFNSNLTHTIDNHGETCTAKIYSEGAQFFGGAMLMTAAEHCKDKASFAVAFDPVVKGRLNLYIYEN